MAKGDMGNQRMKALPVPSLRAPSRLIRPIAANRAWTRRYRKPPYRHEHQIPELASQTSPYQETTHSYQARNASPLGSPRSPLAFHRSVELIQERGVRGAAHTALAVTDMLGPMWDFRHGTRTTIILAPTPIAIIPASILRLRSRLAYHLGTRTPSVGSRHGQCFVTMK